MIAGHALVPGHPDRPAMPFQVTRPARPRGSVDLPHQRGLVSSRVIYALATMRTSGAPAAAAAAGRRAVADLREGLAFVFRTPLIVWTMGVDFLATFFAGAMGCFPSSRTRS